MLLYSRLIIIWEQHDGQILLMATRVHQTLDKTHDNTDELGSHHRDSSTYWTNFFTDLKLGQGSSTMSLQLE